ncbi:MAG TPA: hypothetical protein VM408_04435 [Methylomirabilota bacterium]|nr:hypothetical protein [Methylomirabilota bacterium]
MHDTKLDERLRSMLRHEADGIPFTITSDELERRLLLRRRERNGRRLSLIAAGLAAVAVGAIFALNNGWLANAPVVGTDATPSPAPTTVAPSGSPAPSAPSATQATPRAADPIGTAGQAVLVTPVGEDSQRPDSFEVTRFDPVTGETMKLATIPGSILPKDGWLNGDRPPQISATGWLAIPFTRGPNEDETSPAIAIVDIRAPDADPWILDDYGRMSWDITDKLVMERAGGIFVAWPMSRFVQSFAVRGDLAVQIATNGNGVANGPAITTQESTRFLASTTDDPTTWGYVGFDGAFTATTDLPAVYQRAGTERPLGVDAHGLGMACDSGGAQGGGCFLMETDPRRESFTQWLDIDATPLHDSLWAADGKSVWMVLGGEEEVATLVYAPTTDTHVDRARITHSGFTPRILGIADEPAAGQATVIAIGAGEGFVYRFVLADGTVVRKDGTAWFAGWAEDPPPYDPD